MHDSIQVPATNRPSQIEWRDSRLHRHADYQRAYQSSRKNFSASMSWFFSRRPEQNPLGPARVGLTVGKVIGKAHERNRIKRRMRAAIRNHLASMPAGVDLILHPKRVVMTMEFSQLNAEVRRIFAQAAEQARNPATRTATTPFAVMRKRSGPPTQSSGQSSINSSLRVNPAPRTKPGAGIRSHRKSERPS